MGAVQHKGFTLASLRSTSAGSRTTRSLARLLISNRIQQYCLTHVCLIERLDLALWARIQSQLVGRTLLSLALFICPCMPGLQLHIKLCLGSHHCCLPSSAATTQYMRGSHRRPGTSSAATTQYMRGSHTPPGTSSCDTALAGSGTAVAAWQASAAHAENSSKCAAA